MQTDISVYESVWGTADAPVFFVVGNHEGNGIPSLSEYLSNSIIVTDYAGTSFGNEIIDIPDTDWRIIKYFNADLPYYSAPAESLIFLEAELNTAKTENKKVIIATHCRIDIDYPWGDSTVFFWDFDNEIGTCTPSAISGDGVIITASDASFSEEDIGRTIYLKYGTAYGSAKIISVTSTTSVITDVIINFASTAASEWGWAGTANASYNTDAQWEIIDSAVSAGTRIKYILQGHTHEYSHVTNVRGSGINAYVCPTLMDNKQIIMTIYANDFVKWDEE